jgi:outer membrane protein assembly factor BamB
VDGPVITASGLLFIAGTKDGKFRVYDKKDGKLLWETMLPAPAFATPSTYSVNGKQYIVLACGGTKLGAPKGRKLRCVHTTNSERYKNHHGLTRTWCTNSATQIFYEHIGVGLKLI